MGRVNVGHEDRSVNLFFEDWGNGQPVVFLHGWPLSHEMWEYQFSKLPQHGIRCIAYDRRGFGQSDKPADGYDYTTLAQDLSAFLTALNLQDVVLVGFSMGGGEVVRYLAHGGDKRVSRAMLISSVVPQLIRSSENPEGVPREQFDDMIEKIYADRPAFLASFAKQFYGEGWINKPVSQEMLQWTSMLALKASPLATVQCIRSFSETNFSEDLQQIKVPIHLVHGDADKTVPFITTSNRAVSQIGGATLSVFEGAPHGLFYTDRDKLNDELLNFILPHRIKYQPAS